jgi:4-hydroxy-3-polyprenylbenzoate decarboxylase
VILGIRLLEVLRPMAIETHLVISPAARTTVNAETDWQIKDVMALADVSYAHNDIAAAIASGSYAALGMVDSSDLLTRAADVTLKEGRKLVLVVRETPLHPGHIRLMKLASDAGAVIYPPVAAFYARPQHIDDVVDNIVGRVLMRLGIENELYLKWKA